MAVQCGHHHHQHHEEKEDDDDDTFINFTFYNRKDAVDVCKLFMFSGDFDFDNDNDEDFDQAPNNGFNPTWCEEASFTIRVPELAIIEFRVSAMMIVMSKICLSCFLGF